MNTKSILFSSLWAPFVGAQNIVNIVGAEQASIAVYDVLGRKVWSQVQANNQVQMDVSTLSAGTYFVRLSKGNQTQTEKLIIAR